MPEFNNLSLRDTYGAGVDDRQRREFNALRQEAGQYKFDETKRLENTKWLAGATKYALENPQSLPQLLDEGRRRGIIDPNVQGDISAITPDVLMELHQKAVMGMQGQNRYEDVEPTTPGGPVTQQRQTDTNQLSQVGATSRGPTSPMQNYGERNRLVQQFGEGSPQVQTFDSYVRAPQYQTVNQVPTQLTPSGSKPLSTLESETGAAAQIALAEGEGGRGRLATPSGEFAPVPGTEADVKQKEADRKRSGGAFMKSIQSQTVVEDVNRLNEQIKAGTVPFGRTAAIQKDLHPTIQSDGYRNANSLIESVKGNVGIDSLLRIKATGAGLGQVPQSQLDLLSRLLGELDMNQSEEQFVHTWNRMGKVYEIIMKQADEDLYSLDTERPSVYQEGGVPDDVPPELWEAMTPAEQALWQQ